MGKSTKKKNKKITAPKANIQELSISRDGGQIALRGYSYQFLYSCYLILSSSNPSNFFQLEGIEDIDCIMQKNGSNDITHIQLKYSVNKQDASFLTDVLKNFLEAYLLDQNRFFKLADYGSVFPPAVCRKRMSIFSAIVYIGKCAPFVLTE